jgi:hypothetical protein
MRGSVEFSHSPLMCVFVSELASSVFVILCYIEWRETVVQLIATDFVLVVLEGGGVCICICVGIGRGSVASSVAPYIIKRCRNRLSYFDDLKPRYSLLPF